MKNILLLIVIILCSCKATKTENTFELILNKSTCIPSCGTYNISLNKDNNSISFTTDNDSTIFSEKLNEDEVEQLTVLAMKYEKGVKKNQIITKDYNTYRIAMNGEKSLNDTFKTIYPPEQELLIYFNELISKYTN